MNHAIEEATRHTGEVTARALLAVAKKASILGLHGTAVFDRASYSDSFTFELTSTVTDRKTKSEVRTSIRVPGYATNGYTSEKETVASTTNGKPIENYAGHYRPASGFWYLCCAADHLRAVLEVLPAASLVAFAVRLDTGTTSGMTDKNLHGDALYLIASHKGKVREFLLDTQTGEHNTARFGYAR